jgi:hypothetical protein
MLVDASNMEPGGELRQPGNVLSQAGVKSCLVARAQQREQGAFAALFNIHKRPAYSLCFCMTGDPVEAENTSEEVFISLFSNI